MLMLLNDHIKNGGSIRTWLTKYNIKGDDVKLPEIKKQLSVYLNEADNSVRKERLAAANKRIDEANKKKIAEQEKSAALEIVEKERERIQKKKMPSKLQMAKNLSKFAGDAAKELVKSGSVKTPVSLADKRFSICQKCPHFNNKSNRCGICGCFMKNKVKFTAAKCPDKPPRWK
jgi:hypothetical protein